MKKEKNAIKKPPNGFFLYRRDKKEEIMETFSLNKVHHIAAKAGELWRQEPAHVKSKYQALAYQEFLAFKLKYPDYVWPSPKSKEKKAAQDAAIVAEAAAGSSSSAAVAGPSSVAPTSAAPAAVQQLPFFDFTIPPTSHLNESPSFAFTLPPPPRQQSPSFSLNLAPTSQIHQSPAFPFNLPPLHRQSPQFSFTLPSAGQFQQSPQFAFNLPPNGVQANQMISNNNFVNAGRRNSAPSLVYDTSPQPSLVHSPPQQQFTAFMQRQLAQTSGNVGEGGSSSRDISQALPLMDANNYLGTGTPQNQLSLTAAPQHHPQLFNDFTFPSPYANLPPAPTIGNQNDLDSWFQNTVISNANFNPQDFPFEIKKNDEAGKGFDGGPIQDAAAFGTIVNFKGTALDGSGEMGEVDNLDSQKPSSTLQKSIT